jgi:methionyl-tRNA formyltransferase
VADRRSGDVREGSLGVKIALFAAGAVGERIAAFLASENADVCCVAVAANDAHASAITAYFTDRIIDASDADALRNSAPDLGVLAWWPAILREPQLTIPRLGWLNTHPSLLPFNRGKHYNFWALVEEAPFGVTLHWIDGGVDSGDIAFQRELPTSWEDTGATLYDRAQEAMFALFIESWAEIREGRIPRTPQDPSAGSLHRAAELDAASRIDLNATYRGRDLLNLLRARTFRPHPGAWFTEDGAKYEVRIEITKTEDDEH